MIMPKVFQNDKLLITFGGEKLLIPEKECSFADIKLTSLHIIEMIQTVLKRDGRIVGYNEEKIKAAIRKAMLTTEMGEDEALIQRIVDRIGISGKEQMTVEDIQDRVELELMKSPRKEVAKRYIAYRNQRSVARRAKTRDMFLEIIEAKSNDITRENANMNTDSPAGMMMKFASETTKPFVDDYLLTAEARDAVRHGYLHIHDKDYYPTKSLTCVQHPLDNILRHGSSQVMVNPDLPNGLKRQA